MLTRGRSNRDLHSLLAEIQNGMGTLKDSLVGSCENIFISYYPAVVHLDIDPNDFRIRVHTKTCAPIFPAALYIIDNT